MRPLQNYIARAMELYLNTTEPRYPTTQLTCDNTHMPTRSTRTHTLTHTLPLVLMLQE